MAQLKERTEHEFVIHMLKESLLFQEVSSEILEEVALKMKKKILKKGDPVFIENERSSHVYFIQEGSVEIVRYNAQIKKISRVKILKEGEHFSEFSILTRSSHSTSCFALNDSILWGLDADSFYGILREHNDVPKAIAVKLAGIVQQMTNSQNYIEYYKSEAFSYTDNIKEVLPLDVVNRYKVLPIYFESNILHVAMLDPSNESFIREFGKKYPNIMIKICMINKEDYQKVFTRVLDCYEGREISVSDHGNELHEVISWGEDDLRDILSFTPLFKDLPKGIVDQVVPHFKVEKFSSGDLIFKTGEESDRFFLVQTGKVELVRELTKGGMGHVTYFERNDCFSLISLIANCDHPLTCISRNETIIYTLRKEIFTQLLDTSGFSIPLASMLAKKLQGLNHHSRMNFYTGKMINEQLLAENLLPLSIIRKSKIIPLERKGNELVIGLVNPNDEEIYDIINRHLKNFRIVEYKISEREYSGVVNYLKRSVEESENAYSGISFAGNSNVEAFLKKILVLARDEKTSDIHFDVFEFEMAVRCRIDGELREVHQRVNKEFSSELVNKIKILSDLDISEKRLPQDGQLLLTVSKEEKPIQARVSTVPTKYGEKVVLRLVCDSSRHLPLKLLAPDKDLIHFLNDITRYKQGLFLVSGPTGSGKTTTLYSLISEVNNVNRNIITAEDPVELMIPGTTQVEVNEKTGLTYSKILRHVLRQDPDVIMVGEIRDEESAKLVFDAALTGHLVFSTIHSNNSIDVVSRLMELGVSKETIASGLVGVMAQRLIPKVCQSCHGKEDMINDCKECRKTGMAGRVPVYEYWKNTIEMRDTIISATDNLFENMIDKLYDQGFRSLREFGDIMALNGLTTTKEVEKHLYGMDFYKSHKKGKKKLAS